MANSKKGKPGYALIRTTAKTKTGKMYVTHRWMVDHSNDPVATPKPKRSTPKPASPSPDSVDYKKLNRKFSKKKVRLDHPVDEYPTPDDYTTRFYLPPGNYWVGDPCYAFQDEEEWGEVLGESNFFERPYAITKTGKIVYAHHTAYGDGGYLDDRGREHPVDAGLLGIMPAVEGEETPGGMRSVTWNQRMKVDLSGDGTHNGSFVFGDITIYTDENPYCDECGRELYQGECEYVCDECGEHKNASELCDECDYCQECGEQYPHSWDKHCDCQDEDDYY